MTQRLASRFDQLRAEDRAGFIAYVMAGDPDLEACWEVLHALPGAGADIVELGFPFSDPMADGPAIQAAGRRALAQGVGLADTFALARRFRAAHPETPLILMGYANPVLIRGAARFADEAHGAGADGALIVDMPPEEDTALRGALAARGLALIRLATPTTDAARARIVLENATGFVYYVSVTGVTGTAAASASAIKADVARLKEATALPVVVGFGVREAEQAAALATHADAVVAGSAIVDGLAQGGPVQALKIAAALAAGVRQGRQGARR